MNQEAQMGKTSKKGVITEEDVSTILQRYTAATVITLLQEVGQVQDVKIDWNGLVKRTKTGITSVREYQMLWRHLAYRDELVEKLEDQAKPLDDDSDLEYELEAFPPPNNEASMEAAACVKRWNIIKKRKNVNANVKTGSQLSEVHLAARRALNMALDQPGVNSLKASSSLGRTKSSISSLTSMRPTAPDTPSGTTVLQDQSCEDPSALTKTLPKILPKTTPRSLVNGPDPVKAAAVAAGARIATPSAAAAILKQQLKSAIHIKTNVSSFRDLHSPNASRPLDHVGPVVPLNPVISTAQETNGSTVSSSANSPKKAQQGQAAVFQDASEKEVKENVGLSGEPPVIMDACENESAKQEP